MAGSPTPNRDDEAQERLILPLVIPAIAFLFAVLVVYGLSRIYLDLDTWHYKDVGMATPLAIGIALTILLVSMYLAGRPAPRWQVGFIVLLAAAGLTGGAIWAAVHPETGPTEAVVSPTPGPTVAAGSIGVTLSEFKVEVNPASGAAGAVKFAVTNTGSTIHNFRVIKTELDPADLPIDSSGYSVDEAQVDVVESGKDLDAGNTEELDAQLEAATYVLICNVPTHYQSGMRTTFTVQ